jgi:hypothetical protein
MSFYTKKYTKKSNVVICKLFVMLLVMSVYLVFNCTFLDNNDFMYAAAPVVWSQNGILYRDVPYVQAPLTIFLNSGIMKLFSIENVFLISRSLSMVLVLAAVFVSAFAMRRIKEPEFIFIYSLLCLSNAYILSNSAEIGSYSQPLFLVSVALAVPTLGLVPWVSGLLVGVAVGLSVSAKLNFLLILPAFTLLLLLETERSWRIVVWITVGALIGMLPLLYYAAVDFDALFQRLVRFHYLTLQSRGLDSLKSVSQILTQLSGFTIVMVVPMAFLVRRLVDKPQGERWRATLIALGFVGCSIVMAILPRTVNPQYLAPLAMVLMFFCLPDLGTPLERKRTLWIIGVTFFVIQFSSMLIQLAQRIASEKHLAILEVVNMQRQAASIAATLTKCDRRIYTSQPLFLLSKDVRYPAELGAGPFLLALRGGMLRPEDVGVDIDARLDSWAPNILIYGFYADQNYNNFLEVDAKVQNYAKAHGFETKVLGAVTNRDVIIAYNKACL